MSINATFEKLPIMNQSLSYRLRIEPSYEAHYQIYPFANSKDLMLNGKIIRQVQSDVEVRDFNLAENKNSINWQAFEIEQELILSLTDSIGQTLFHSSPDSISTKQRNLLDELIDDFTWKFQHDLPANRILSFGCGNGGELFFIRDKYPNAIIDAVDWQKKVPDSVLNRLNITFIETNVYDYLDSHKFTYDFIYSSHTLEHSYRVQTLLDLLYQSLIAGGYLTGNLPLCAFGDTKYTLFLKKVLNDKSQKLRQLDCGLLDLGHPWKTNEVDLDYSLRDAGFRDIKIYGNLSRCVRGKSITPSQWEKATNFKFLLSSATFGLLKKTLYLFFSDPFPYFLTKLYFAIDTRLPFGGVRIANFVPEVFFVAQKPAYGESVLNNGSLD